MIVVANGSEIEMADGATVADLIEHLDLGRRVIVVERNGEPVLRADHATTRLTAGDRLELVRAAAGG